MKRQAMLACALVISLGNVQSAATGAPHAQMNAWTTPHVFTISDAADPETLNPHLSQSGPVANMSEMTMAWLVRFDKHNQPYPELATEVPSVANGGISADGLTITYHIRKGVRWSDGAPFNADDVVFSTNVVNNKANNESGRFDQIASVEAPDKYTVVDHLKKHDATFIVSYFSSCCANPSLLPKHLLEKYPNINNVPYNSLPVGIGPFKFERWDRGKQVVLAANPLYWRGKPKLKKIIYRIIPNRDKLLEEITAHRVDMWYQFSGAYLERVAALPGYTIIRRPSYAWNHLDFNLTHPAVADPIVRQALRIALDRQGIVDRVDHGVGVVRDAAIPVSAPYFTDLGTTAYDPGRANALLDQAGWVRGSDGVRAKNGIRLEINIATAAGRQDTDHELEVVRDNWKAVGVDAHVIHYPSATMFTPGDQGGVVFGGKWDVVVFAWAANPVGDYSAMFGCDQMPPAGGNDVHWCNKTAQGAMDALLGHYQESDRNADIKTVMEEFVKDTPSIVLAIREDIFAYNKDLKNYDPNTVTPFDNMMTVDI